MVKRFEVGAEKPEGAIDVGLEEGFGSGNGAIDVTLGREVNNGEGHVFGEQALH